jgi:hypothetical protein
MHHEQSRRQHRGRAPQYTLIMLSAVLECATNSHVHKWAELNLCTCHSLLISGPNGADANLHMLRTGCCMPSALQLHRLLSPAMKCCGSIQGRTCSQSVAAVQDHIDVWYVTVLTPYSSAFQFIAHSRHAVMKQLLHSQINMLDMLCNRRLRCTGLINQITQVLITTILIRGAVFGMMHHSIGVASDECIALELSLMNRYSHP